MSEAFPEQTEENKEAIKGNYVVRTRIARIGKKKQKSGRPKQKTPRQMVNGMNSYFEWCEKSDRVPSIKGMMLHIQMHREQFYEYLKYPDYVDIMEQAKLAIVEWVENDIYRTPGQCAGKIAYAKNVHNWADKIDTTSVNENRNTTILTVEDAKAKIASLAHLIDPKLLEAFSNSYTVNQIAHVVEAVDAEN
jgi:hypothetical protein